MINGPVLKGGCARSLLSLKRGGYRENIKQKDYATFQTSTFVKNLTVMASQHVCGRNRNHHFKKKVPHKPNRLSSTSQIMVANSIIILGGEKII